MIALFSFCLFVTSLFGGHSALPKYSYDQHGVRYELYQNNGQKNFNWLLIPGGPGADSCYLRSLADELHLPGKVWLIDLPGNGSNVNASYSEAYDKWFEILPQVVKKFENPIILGHSFGGMMPMQLPELENHLKGFVILNSAPRFWLEEAAAYSKQFHLPDVTVYEKEFVQNPNQKTFEALLNVCMPYYFPKETLEKGRKLLTGMPFQYRPAVWGLKKAASGEMNAKWIPQKVPTLIVGAKYDCIAPFSLFTKDERFQRKNITLVYIEDGGHCPWVENPAAVRKAVSDFYKGL